MKASVRAIWPGLLLAVLAGNAVAAVPEQSLRVCADPNNLPFSNARGEGFENRLAEMVARDLGKRVAYTWWAQRRGFFRNTLNAGRCDVVMGVPAASERVLATRPYYRSTYVLVHRRDLPAPPRSLDDPALRNLCIGLHFVGDDYQNPPPAEELARRGIVRNIVGFSLYGDYREPDPPARLIEAVAQGRVDVAIAWGPLAGYFARRQPVPLAVVPLPEPTGAGSLPFRFALALGTRKDDTRLRDRLDRVLVRRRTAIARLLKDFGVPLVPDDPA